MPRTLKKLIVAIPGPAVEQISTYASLSLDAPGLFFVEARSRIELGAKGLAILLPEFEAHTARVALARDTTDVEDRESAWSNFNRELGRLEKQIGAAISCFLVADVLLVAAAEAYVNSIAAYVLSTSENENFDKLSPVGKWLFLPKIMKLDWQPSVSEGALQQFASTVARRNRVVHGKQFTIGSVEEVREFIRRLKVDAKLGRASVGAVRELIRELSLSWRGSTGPRWLDTKAATARPPCFVLGSAFAPVQLAQARRRQAKVDA